MKLNYFLTFILAIIIPAETIQCQEFSEANAYSWGGSKVYSDPAFYDLDYDGLIDILVGKYNGNIMHYKQQSVNSNQFILVNRKFSNIDYVTYTTTCIYDIDHDSLPDLFMCNFYDGLQIWEADTIGSLNFVYKASGPDVGVWTSPSVSDIDGDGLADLLIGEQMGVIYHFEKIDSSSYQFEFITNNFSNIDVGFRAKPEITDLDNDGLFDLLVGRSGVSINHFEQIQNNSYEFILVNYNMGNIFVGDNCSPGVVDLSNDNHMDLFIGENHGNLNHYRQIGEFSEDFELISEFPCGINSGYGAVPAITDLENDGRLDLLLGNKDGKIDYYIQSETDPISFEIEERLFGQMTVYQQCAPAITDFENDGLLDIVLGSDTKLVHYVQVSPGSHEFTIADNNFLGLNNLSFTSPTFTDFNENGLIDLLIGNGEGSILYYEQSQVNSGLFTLMSLNFGGISMENFCFPACADFDNNGLYDLLIGDGYGDVHYYRQVVEGSENFELITSNFLDINVENHARPTFADINGDGLIDILVGGYHGGVNLYLNNIFLEVNQNVFNLTSSSIGTLNIEISSNTQWNVYENCNWLDLNITSGQNDDIISVIYQQNLSSHPRSYSFLIVGSGILRMVTVNQAGFTSGKKNHLSEERIKINPNPCTNGTIYAYVDLNPEILINNISIYSATGNVVKSIDHLNGANKLIKIDVRELKHGLYFVRINTSSGGAIIKKLVIVNNKW